MIKKFNIFPSFEFDYEEEWINDLAQKGYLFTKKRLHTYYFEESDFRGRRYKIIPKKLVAFKEDELQIFEDNGWKFIYEKKTPIGSDNWCLFYTDDADAPDIFTDNESYRDYMKNLIFYFRILMILSVLCIVGIPSDLSMTSLDVYLYGGLNGLAQNSMLGDLAYICVCFYFIILFIYWGIGCYKCNKRILGKDDNNLPKDHGQKVVLKAIGNTAWSAFGIVLIIALILGGFGNSSEVRGKAVMSYDDPSPVLFREFDPEAWDFASNHFGFIPPDEENSAQYDYELNKSNNLILNNGYEESLFCSSIVTTGESETYNYPEYTSLTFDFKSEKLAKKVLARQIYIDKDASYSEKTTIDGINKLDVPGADLACYYEQENGLGQTFQTICLRKGSRVVYVSYSGDKKLLDKLSLFADQLSKGE